MSSCLARPLLPMLCLLLLLLGPAALAAGPPAPESAAGTAGGGLEASSEGLGGTGIQSYRAATDMYRFQTYQNKTQLPLSQIKLPQGFHIALYTNSTVTAARSLALSGDSNKNQTIVYVGSDEAGEEGVVQALIDRGSDGKADELCILLRDLEHPNGVAWHNGSLFVMETTRLTRYDNIDNAVLQGCNINKAHKTVLISNYPNQTDHFARYIAVGPDGKLYVGVGTPLNLVACGVENGVQMCSIMRMNLDGSQQEVYAYGVRNTVGFDWNPLTKDLYFGFLERDWQGDNQPDDYLYAAPVPGLHFGYPYCHWQGFGDPRLRELGPGYALADNVLVPPGVEPLVAASGEKVGSAPYNATAGLYCQETTPPPVQALGPHVAALGVKFYHVPTVKGISPDSWFPAGFNSTGTVFIAEHGSWNRESAIGYRVAMVEVAPDGRSLKHSVFASGWLQGEGTPQQSFWGRPSGLLVLPDGSLLVSDDFADAVYRISYGAA